MTGRGRKEKERKKKEIKEEEKVVWGMRVEKGRG